MKRSLAVDIGLPFGLLILLCIVSFAVGQFPVSLHDLFAVLWAKISGTASGVAPAVDAVVWRIRLPRIAAAVLVGAALSGAGSTYQGLFRNPLVSPDILGVAAGAGLGAVLGIFLSASILWVELLAFAGGLGAVAVVYLIGTAMRGRDPVPAILIGLIPLYLLRWRMNVMTLGEEEAKSLGVNTAVLRFLFIAGATLITSAAVSISGIIGWIGLIIPHVARLIAGPEFSRLLPVSMLFGAAYLLLVDTLARTIATIEIPIGVLTAFIGAPFFLWLLASSRRGWQ